MRIRPLLAWFWTAAILGLCWYPRGMMPVDESRRIPFLFPHFDKAVHFGIFAVFAALWMWARLPARRVLLAGLALTFLSEIGQELPAVGRDATFLDGLADAAGVAGGVIVALALSRPKTEAPPA